MRFDSYLDFQLFKQAALSSASDAATITRLQSLVDVERIIPDDLFYVFSDSTSAYYQELRFHSKDKSFYRKLKTDTLTLDHIACLHSLLTHFSLALQNRVSTRKHCSYDSYKVLRDQVNNLIEGILTNGSVDNSIKPLLFP